MRAAATLFRRAKPLLGTLVEVACYTADGGDETDVLHASEQAFQAVARVQRLLSRHESTSELSGINRLAPGEWLHISQPTLDVLKFAQALSQQTDGVFDVISTSAHATAGSNWRDLELDEPNARLRTHTALQADLGGIAKGYAVDAAVQALQAGGVHSGWVNAGGDLRTFGSYALPLKVRAPWDTGFTLDCGSLRNQSAATSASYLLAQPLLKNGVTQALAPANASYTVTASSCMAADALTKLVAAGPTACPALGALLLQFKACAFTHRKPSVPSSLHVPDKHTA